MNQNDDSINGQPGNAPAGDAFLGSVVFQPGGNHAPVIAGVNVTFPQTNQLPGSSAQGTDLASWIAANVTITDPDPGAEQGIAITAVGDTNGSWQYSLDGGTTWNAITGVSETNALLLQASATDRVRFLPGTATFTGSATFSFHAWDLTSGTNGGFGDASINGGTTAFSTGEDTATTAVGFFVNTPPSFTAGPNESTPENGPLQTIPNWATNISAGPPSEAGQDAYLHRDEQQ